MKKQIIHASRFIDHPTKKGCLLETSMCGHKNVPIASFFGGKHKLSEINCKTCIKAMNSPKNQCESPL